MSKQPNILFVLTDQQRWDYVGYAGGPPRTPNIDRIAARGVAFNHCYTSCPICAPARIALAAGMQAGRIASNSNDSYLHRSTTTYYQRLRDYGYRVGAVGKLDLAKTGGPPGLAGDLPRNYVWGFTHPVETEGKWAAGTRPTAFGPYTKLLEDRGLQAKLHEDYRYRSSVSFPEASYPSILPDELFADTWIGQRSVQWLEEIPRDAPWHLFVSFVGPHDPFDPPAKYVEPYENMDMPPAIDADLTGKPAWLGASGHYDPAEAEDVAKARRHYCGAIEAIDDQVGFILQALEARGELDNTYIIFSSDHGENLGDHGTWEKQLAYDPSIRVPLAVAGPGIEGGRTSDAMIELIDINPLICAMAGLPPQENLDARDFSPVLRSQTHEHRDFIYTMMPRFHCVRTRRHKFVNNMNDIDELYDMQDDPEELHNIAETDPDTAGELRRLLKRRIQEGRWLH